MRHVPNHLPEPENSVDKTFYISHSEQLPRQMERGDKRVTRGFVVEFLTERVFFVLQREAMDFAYAAVRSSNTSALEIFRGALQVESAEGSCICVRTLFIGEKVDEA